MQLESKRGRCHCEGGWFRATEIEAVQVKEFSTVNEEVQHVVGTMSYPLWLRLREHWRSWLHTSQKQLGKGGAWGLNFIRQNGEVKFLYRAR